MRAIFILIYAACIPFMCAAPFVANYDEEKVGTFYLPEPLTMVDGTLVKTAEDWKTKRRPEILELYRKHMFGRSPGRPEDLKFEVKSTKADALDGLATRKEILIRADSKPEWKGIMVLVYTPNKSPKPAPAFAGLSFGGNHAVTTETDVAISKHWTSNNRATEATRGKEASRWPLKMILERGYALATADYGDIEPDHTEGWKESVRSHFGDYTKAPDQAPEGWGAIAAWAWGLSRIMDLLETLPEIDSRKVAVIGHSRLGKTSLWAGAQDERFGIVISNDSGEGGAAISRRNFGETVERINSSFPHWFNGNYKKYNQAVNSLPVDSHLVISLAAPRPVYVASAAEDQWADPKGEFLGAVYASPVYKLFGKEGLKEIKQPPVNQPVGNYIGYHIRTGKHDVTDYDWEQYLNFADRHFRSGGAR
jgi:hypothetical protein